MDFISPKDRISFFEMAPMNELSSFLRNALTYLLNIATSHYESLVGLRYYTQDVVFSIETLLNLWYLLRKKATYAEAFYGFTRSKQSSGQLKPLSTFDLVICLFFETVLPYLKIKLEAFTNNPENRMSKLARRLTTIAIKLG
jgi:hypothetical protein